MSSLPSTVHQPSDLAYSPGDVIAGKYALEELLGTGGMGAVFRARNTVIDMPVAIKLIRADLDREQLTGRLLQEARAAAKLAHPAIVRVFDVGTTALGDPFIVMELLQGESLASVLEREGRLPSARAVQLLLPIADALAVAHGKGFVHRDVKPDNVFIVNDEEGQLQPKLVDFGIVKTEHPSGDRQLTQIGAVMGSPDYMSPEQARGLEHVDLRSDVWSFSVVLYETISGDVPFSSDNYNALLRLIVESEAPSLRERSLADAALSAIVERGMRKDPGERFGSMAQMGKELARWLYQQGFNEDACGVSLEARWLSRSGSPAPVAISSFPPEGWPEPLSGVRTVSAKLARRLGRSSTRPERSAGTPISLTASATPASRQQKAIYVAAASLLLLAAGTLAWLTLSTPGRGGPSATSAAAPQPETLPERIRPPVPVPAPLPVPSAAPADVKTPLPESAETIPDTSKQAKPSHPEHTKAEKAARPRSISGSEPAVKDPPAAEAEPKPKPASDLLAPY